MKLYLVQHGEAKSEEQDPERPLTDAGRSDAEKVAARLAAAGTATPEIFHSGKLRAEQTAQVFASALGASHAEIEGLKPNDSPEAAARFIESRDADTMIVGHLPHMARLASMLAAGSEADVVAFRNAAVVCLVKEDKWRISWILTPELA